MTNGILIFETSEGAPNVNGFQQIHRIKFFDSRLKSKHLSDNEYILSSIHMNIDKYLGQEYALDVYDNIDFVFQRDFKKSCFVHEAGCSPKLIDIIKNFNNLEILRETSTGYRVTTIPSVNNIYFYGLPENLVWKDVNYPDAARINRAMFQAATPLASINALKRELLRSGNIEMLNVVESREDELYSLEPTEFDDSSEDSVGADTSLPDEMFESRVFEMQDDDTLKILDNATLMETDFVSSTRYFH